MTWWYKYRTRRCVCSHQTNTAILKQWHLTRLVRTIENVLKYWTVRTSCARGTCTSTVASISKYTRVCTHVRVCARAPSGCFRSASLLSVMLMNLMIFPPPWTSPPLCPLLVFPHFYYTSPSRSPFSSLSLSLSFSLFILNSPIKKKYSTCMCSVDKINLWT